MTTVLSGIQPTGQLHSGNYFGAIKQHIALSHETKYKSLFFIANYHALTSLTNGELLRKNTHDIASIYLALGLHPDALLFRQSDISAVTELKWLLDCVTGMGLLTRAGAYKEKIANGLTPNLGLFSYPMLMAADILIYKSDIVPVGKDQIQHLEIAADVATHFNTAYGKYILKLPTPHLSPDSKVPGIDGRKMSKSYKNTIDLFDSKNIGLIVTDSRSPNEPKPDVKDLVCYQILSLYLTTSERQQWEQDIAKGGVGYGTIKKEIQLRHEALFSEAKEKFRFFTEDQDGIKEVEDKLTVSGAAARKIAQTTLDECRAICGL